MAAQREASVGSEPDRQVAHHLVPGEQFHRRERQRERLAEFAGAGVAGIGHGPGGRHPQRRPYVGVVGPFTGEGVEQVACRREVAAFEVDSGQKQLHLPGGRAGAARDGLQPGDEFPIGDRPPTPPEQATVVHGPDVVRVDRECLVEGMLGVRGPVQVEEREATVVELVGTQIGGL
ncbi:hypothetical protein GA0115260_110073 [Streptomyces sp. MnatMP-M27]|nr:hypothetical protein GA0115260_110073 [Streptomyces sp. MnatMP-M27]